STSRNDNYAAHSLRPGNDDQQHIGFASEHKEMVGNYVAEVKRVSSLPARFAGLPEAGPTSAAGQERWRTDLADPAAGSCCQSDRIGRGSLELPLLGGLSAHLPIERRWAKCARRPAVDTQTLAHHDRPSSAEPTSRRRRWANRRPN